MLNRIENVRNVKQLTPSISSGTCRNLLKGAFFEGTEPDKIVAVMAYDVDMRIFVQQGCFTIHASNTALNERPKNDKYLFPLVIPAERAKDIANELFVAGFRKGDIYPDLDNLSKELSEINNFTETRFEEARRDPRD